MPGLIGFQFLNSYIVCDHQRYQGLSGKWKVEILLSICRLDSPNLSLPFHRSLHFFNIHCAACQKSYKGTEARLSKIRWPTKPQKTNKQICRLILRKMINFSYLCNYLFSMVESYFQPFFYPKNDLSSKMFYFAV